MSETERERLAGIIRDARWKGHAPTLGCRQNDLAAANAILSDPAYGRAREMREVIKGILQFVDENPSATPAELWGMMDGEIDRARALTEGGE